MLKIVTVVLTVLCVIYVDALPPGGRVRRGYNNSGSGSGRGGGGFFDESSYERDASVSREDGGRRGQDCDSEEENDSREHTYGRDDYGDNDRRYGGRRPRKAD